MNMKMKKFIGILLGLALVLGLMAGMSLTTAAADHEIVDLSKLTGDFEAGNYDYLTGTLGSGYKLTIAAGATVTLSKVTVTQQNDYPGIVCLGDATIELMDYTTTTVTATKNDYPGIYVPSGKTLTIKGPGRLNVTGGQRGAGIGAGCNAAYQKCGNIVIESGIINATGLDGAAGIGLGSYSGGTCGDITIRGGTVTATGQNGGAGIGTGGFTPEDQNCGNITITGGTVTATGTRTAAGIGTGSGSWTGKKRCGNITIANTVTKVTATRGESADDTIGIGFVGSCGAIKIGDQWPGRISSSTFIYIPVSGIALSPDTAQEIPVAGNSAFTAAISGSDATYKTVRWSVSDRNVIRLYKDEACTEEIDYNAVVSAGTVYAKGRSRGNATITVTSVDNTAKTVSCDVTAYHYHDFKYSASGATITAECQNIGCHLNPKPTLTLKGPDNNTYNGSAINAEIIASANWTTGDGLPAIPTIVYFGTEHSAAPINAGYYFASITVNGETAVKSFTINQADITPAVTMTDYSTAITPPAPRVSGNPGGGAVTCSYTGRNRTSYGPSAEAPTVAGYYTVEVTVAATTNYKGGTASTDFRVFQSIADAEVALNLPGNLEYDGYEKVVSLKSVTLNGTVLTENIDFTVSGALKGTNVGHYTVTVTGKGDYADSAYATWSITSQTAPTIVTLPTAGAITYGQALSDSALTGGVVKFNGDEITGTFTWKEGDTRPTVADSRKTLYTIVFTPADDQQASVDGLLTLTVNPAENPAVITDQAGLTIGGNTMDLAGYVTNPVGSAVTYTLSEANGCTLEGSTLRSGYELGTCTVTVSVEGDQNHKAKTGTITVTLTGKDTQELRFEKNQITKTWGAAPFVNPLSGAKTPVTYAVTDGADVASVAADGTVTILKTGTATIIAMAEETEQILGATARYTLTVNEVPVAVPAAVTANNRTYDGTEQPLVTVTGEAAGGTMQYALGTATAATEPYTASVPAKTDAGTYYVWYMAKGDETHNDSNPACVSVTIAGKPDPEPEPTDRVVVFVTRCYAEIMGRNPDQGGLEYWVTQLRSKGKSAAECIYGFLTSKEFSGRKCTNWQLIEILYKTMMNRSADTGGMEYWLNKIWSGASYADLVNGFCSSAEFRNICAWYGIIPGSVKGSDGTKPAPLPAVDVTAVEAFITRCYRLMLNRDPDQGGLKYWTDAMVNGKSAAEVVYGFMTSKEQTSRQLSARQTIQILYQTMLDRQPDEKGMAYWLSCIDRGDNLAAIVNGFADSAEFKAFCKKYGIVSGRVAGAKQGSNAQPTEAWNAEKLKAFIGRVYVKAFGREAGEGETDYWTSRILNGKSSPKQAVKEILNSNEFRAKSLQGEELIRTAYRVYLDREADESGLSYWTGRLNAGASVSDMLDGFAASAEFNKVVAGLK